MKFAVLKVDSKSNFEKINKLADFIVDRTKIVTLFHQNKISSNLIHCVFNINDEYQIGTKIGGSHTNIPMSQYINSFYETKTNYFFVERQNDKYVDTIIHYLYDVDIDVSKCKLDPKNIIRLCEKFDAKIKKVEIQDAEGENEFLGPISLEKLKEKVDENNTIEFISIVSDDQYISFYKSGTVSVDNSNKEYLKHFLEDVSNELKEKIDI